jgi:molybdate transport system substrate-binding protein
MARWIVHIFILLVIVLAPACAPLAPAPAQPATLTILAAASLTEAFKDLGKQFEAQHPGARVEFNFAGSQQLVQQIANGAPADVFASADQRQMDAAIASKRIDQASVQLFARNRLVVIFPLSTGSNTRDLRDLARPGLKMVLAAKEVPVGQYSLQFLAKASRDPAFGAAFEADVLKNVVSYEENVKGVLTKVALGEADAGIVYTSDVANSSQKVSQVAIPDALNVIAQYPIAPLQDAHSASLAKEFVALVLSPQGQETLAKYGFIPVGK